MIQSTVLPHHKDMAAKAAGYQSWHGAANRWLGSDTIMKSILAHAQTLANDEAKGKALAEIAEIADSSRLEGFALRLDMIAAIAAPYRAPAPEYGRVHTDGSRSGGQPVTECPKCEDQAGIIACLRAELSLAQTQLEGCDAFRREVSDAVTIWQGLFENLTPHKSGQFVATYCANEFNSTPFSSCCRTASMGKSCAKCGEEITHHQHSPAVLRARELHRQNRCGMCGSPKGNPAVSGNCHC